MILRNMPASLVYDVLCCQGKRLGWGFGERQGVWQFVAAYDGWRDTSGHFRMLTDDGEMEEKEGTFGYDLSGGGVLLGNFKLNKPLHYVGMYFDWCPVHAVKLKDGKVFVRFIDGGPRLYRTKDFRSPRQ